MTSMQKSISLNPSSSQINQIAAVSGYTPYPRLDGPFDRVNRTVVRFDKAALALSNCICRGLGLILFDCRPQSCLWSSITNPFSLNQIALGTFSCLLPICTYQVLRFLSISLDCIFKSISVFYPSSYCFTRPTKDPKVVTWLYDMSSSHLAVR